MILNIVRFSNTTSAITFQQFVNVMSGKRTQSFTCAVHWRDRQVGRIGIFSRKLRTFQSTRAREPGYNPSNICD